MSITHLARICWNSAHWTRPTGEAAQLEHGDTYCATRGFGHEEWLFDFEWLVDGWKYAFLQPVNGSSEQLIGSRIHVGLYTIAPQSRWYYVGAIRDCEILSEELAAEALADLDRRGALREMREQLKIIGADANGLNHDTARLLLNVRFRPQDATQYEPLVEVPGSHAIRGMGRYKLVSAPESVDPVRAQWATRRASDREQATGVRERAGTPPTTYELQHSAMQNELVALLRKQLGAERVLVEQDRADLKVIEDGDGVRLIELKSDPVPRRAIREALGQLLEYAFRCGLRHQRVIEMIVAGPGVLGDADRAFVAHLNERHGLKLRYAVWRRGETTFDLRPPLVA